MAVVAGLGCLVFVNRYLFLEPRLPVPIPKLLQEALKYSPACLLTAICGPIILMEEGALRAFPDNPYLCAIVIAALVRHMVVAVLLSLLLFYALVYCPA